MTDLIVYHDESCPLCCREIAFYRGRTEADFVDVSDPGNAPDDLSPEAAMARFHVREDGALLSGAAAFAALWRRTKGMRLLGKIAALPGIATVLEWGYRAFLTVRPRLQAFMGRKACPVDGCR